MTAETMCYSDFCQHRQRKSAIARGVYVDADELFRCPRCGQERAGRLEHGEPAVCQGCNLWMVRHGNQLTIEANAEKAEAAERARLEKERLERAAPKLLAACRAAREFDWKSGEGAAALYAQLAAAIAEAEGAQQP